MSTRILHVTPYFKPDVGFGGPVFSVSALCNALAATGNAVTVFTIGYDKTAVYPLKKQVDGLTVWYFKSDYGKPCQVSFQLWRALRRDAGQFDVVHFHTWWNILIFNGLYILKRKGVPTVLSPRGMLSPYSFTHRKTRLKQWFQRSAGIELLQSVALHATSVAETADLEIRSGQPASAIYNLPNLLALRQQGQYVPVTGNFKLGFLSRLHHKKGIEVLLQAIAHTPEVDELIIGGGGEPAYEALLRQQVADLGIAHKVKFTGWVTQDKKAEFFSQFHVFILPSFNENFANVVAEAWAAGKPVIISKEVGLSSYLIDGKLGWLCNPHLRSVVQAIRAAHEGKSQWAAMGEAALHLVANSFSDAQTVNGYLAMYRAVSERRAVRDLKNGAAAVAGGHQTAVANEYILGINAHHADASAAILCNGKLLAAIEEERFTRVKHWAGFPKQAIAFCLKEAGITLDEVHYIALGRSPQAKWLQKAKFALRHPAALSFALKGRLNNAASAVLPELQQIGQLQNDAGLKDKLRYVEHHRSHLASAFYASPFETAALLSIDGSGDFTTTMTGIGRGADIEVLGSIDFPHSLGIFYSAFTQLLGFPNYGDEYKVMGLAPYGRPVYAEKLKQVISWKPDGSFRLQPRFFRPPQKSYISYNGQNQPEVPVLYSAGLVALFGRARETEEVILQHHRDLAASVQFITEETIFHILRHLHKITGLSNLCLAGGVAQNSVANGKISTHTPFKNIFVPPAGHDAGLSLGAAWFVHHQQPGNVLRHPMRHAYTGSGFDNSEIEKLLTQNAMNFVKIEYFDNLCRRVVNCLADGGVVGWFRGRAEFGPRALGNRSILADPRQKEARQILNEKIKRRESFRPFAPSILCEYTDEYFETSDQVPFMEKVFPVRFEKRTLIPAVTHTDGTGRLQTVSKETNPDFYQLIDTFRQLTGVPILLNTSFNENEPIVNAPAEALDCYLRTKMDMLVMEDFILSKR